MKKSTAPLVINKIAKPITWDVYVMETLRRRKEQKLNQKTHAALAKVSLPTMRAFERGEITLSLRTAFKIMRVIGL